MSWKGWDSYLPPSELKGTTSDNLLRVGPEKPKRSKYGAEPTTVDNIRFDSKRESERYSELKLLEKAGEIRILQVQPRFPLWVRGAPAEPITIGEYRGDFSYTRNDTHTMVVEDVKGMDTPLSKWKRKHVAAQYDIEVRIIK